MPFVHAWSAVSLVTLLSLSFSFPSLLHAEDLTIHIIPHSHCDPGWLNTFEGYFGQDVDTILGAVTRALKQNPNRKFVWSETSFFSRWYESQPNPIRTDFQSLIDSGQLEFVGGGWVQNDEANPDYIAVINQLTAGHDYLLKNFNVVPKIAWQIDPFGHSAVSPSLFALAGYDALVINRIHHTLKNEFKNARHMEFIWRGMDVGENVDMFTHVLHTHYSAPQGYDWEDGAPRIYDSTVSSRAEQLVSMMRQRAQAYRSSHLLVPFGDDFKFKQAQLQFENMDQLITYINNNQHFNVKIQYSTLSEYFIAVQKEATTKSIAFPLFQGDFYPYADNDDSYWTGYFTTRPLLKQSSRRLESDVRAAEMLHTLLRGAPDSDRDTNMQILPASYWENKFKDIERARQDTALFLHHDAITGTSRSNVVDDYLSRMARSSDNLRVIMTRMLEHAMTKEPNPSPRMTHQPFVLEPSGEHVHPITLYNTLAWNRLDVVSLTVSSRFVAIKNPAGELVDAQIQSHFPTHGAVVQDQSFVVSFVAQLPPVGAITYFVHVYQDATEAGDQIKRTQIAKTIVYVASSSDKLRGGATSKSSFVEIEDLSNAKDVRIENDLISAVFNSQGLLSALHDRVAKTEIQLSQKFAHYTTSRSGAYLFRPQYKNKMDGLPNTPFRVVRGNIISSVTTTFQNKWDIQFTLVAGSDLSLAGHLAYTQTVSAEPNTEVVMELDTDMNSAEFHTSSGLGFLKRSRKSNPAANFYPCVQGARLTVADGFLTKSQRLTVLTSHSMAAGTQDDGQMEFMLHRYLNQDDGRGLAQAVADSSVVEIKLWLSLDAKRDELDYRRRSLMLNHPILTFYQLGMDDKKQHMGKRIDIDQKQWTTFKPLKAPLPDHIHMLSLMTKDSITDEVAVRFQSLSADAGTGWGKDLDDVFTNIYAITDLRQASLTLNQVYPVGGHVASERLSWPYASSNDQKEWTTLKPIIQVENQNSEEEGVFISNAALEQKKRDAEAAAAASRGRRLLRHLLSVASTLITVQPLQIQSFIFRMSGNVAAPERPETPIHTENHHVTDEHHQGQGPIRTSTSCVDGRTDPLYCKLKAFSHQHTHTVMPGQGRHILPSRWEYIFILIAMIALVLFYLSLLQLNACRQIKRRTMYVMED